MGRANASQAALEARETLLADAFELLSHRTSERLAAVEAAREQREAWGSAIDRLDEALGKMDLKSASARKFERCPYPSSSTPQKSPMGSSAATPPC